MGFFTDCVRVIAREAKRPSFYIKIASGFQTVSIIRKPFKGFMAAFMTLSKDIPERRGARKGARRGWTLLLTVLPAMLALSLAFPSAASAVDPLTNGNFNGQSPWVVVRVSGTNTTETCSYVSTPTHTADSSGSVNAHADQRNDAVTCTVTQTLGTPIAIGASIDSVSIWHLLSTSHESTVDPDNVKVDLEYSDTTTVNIADSGELTDNASWLNTTGGGTQSLPFTTGKVVSKVIITMQAASGNNNGAVADLYADDIVIGFTPPNATPVASQADITGADNPVYPGISYSITAKYSDADGATDLADMFLQLNHDSATDIIWHVTEAGASASGNVTVDQGGAFLENDGSPAPTYSYTTSGNEITVTYTFTLDWDWTDSTNIEYGVRATDASDDSGYSFTDINVQYEKDLDFSGTLSVNGSVQGGPLTSGDWVQGGGTETLTWTGLTVVFEGSSTSPASDGDYDIRITDDDGDTWTQTTVATLDLDTTPDTATDTSDIHQVGIIGFPTGSSDQSDVQFTVKVDTTLPVVASADDTSSTTVAVVFTEDHSGLDQSSAVNTANYTVYDNSGACSGTELTINSASRSGNTVTLTLAADLTSNNDYCVDVTGVEDVVGNATDEANDTATFTFIAQTIVGDGFLPSDQFAAASTADLLVSTFTLETEVGTDSVSAIEVTLGVTGVDGDVDSVEIYRDDGLTADEFDVNDTQIGTSQSFSSRVATFSITPNESVTTTPQQYLIVFDISASPVDTNTLTAAVTDITVSNVLQNNDNADATITIDTAQPVVASAAAIDETNIDVVFTESGSGMDQTSSENAGNYTIYQSDCSGASGISVSNASLSGTTVRLTVSTMTEGITYCVVVNTTNVKDNVGNTVGADPDDRATFNFSQDETAPGVVSDLGVGTATTAGSNPPAAVNDMAVEESYMRGFLLSWGIPSDDGSTGVPSSYDVRFIDAVDYPASITSSFPWGSSALQGANEPTPGPSPTAIQLTWTAPGDDGDSGTATSYDVRYSTTGPITEADWSSATQASGEPSPPQAAGSTEDFTVTGLEVSTQYWFAMKSSDDKANTSDLSNTFAAGTGDDTDDYFSLACAWNGSDNSTCSSTDGESSLWPNTLYYVAIKSEDSASNSSNISNIVSAHTAMKHGYNMTGIPYDIASATSTFSTNFIDNVSSGSNTPVIYTWDSLGTDFTASRFNGRWTRVSATAALNTESNGTGFYIYSWGSTDNVLDVDTGTVSEYGDEAGEDWVGISLTKGRNLIGSPYLKNVPFTSIKICQDTAFSTSSGCDNTGGGTIKDFANDGETGAVTEGWVDGNIFHFLNSTTADKESCVSGDCLAELRPWWGHWIYLLADPTNTYRIAIPRP
jgi:hypothetical protein